MTNDALHKKKPKPAAKLQQKVSGSDQAVQARNAAEAFFALWQDALRDSASLRDLLPAEPHSAAHDDA